MATEVSQMQTWPGSASTTGAMAVALGDSQGKPASAQPLWGHILPTQPTASVHGCLILSVSAAECSILFISDLIP